MYIERFEWQRDFLFVIASSYSPARLWWQANSNSDQWHPGPTLADSGQLVVQLQRRAHLVSMATRVHHESDTYKKTKPKKVYPLCSTLSSDH
jgi:hypothetical protein